MEWKFQPKHPGTGKARNPLGDEFFTDAELLTDASSLVREAIQNSLDAKEDLEEVLLVRFKIGSRRFDLSQPNPFIGLEPHTVAALGSDSGLISPECKFLVYEDFNTVGLLGDSGLDLASSGLEKRQQSYTYFVHYEGEGSKEEGSRGKWGVGKVVFPKISKIKAHFNYSVRDSEYAPCGKTNVLIGQSVLKFHEVDGKAFQPDGWFAREMDGVPLPFSGEVAQSFVEGWGVTRKINETGLSVVVPYVSQELQIAQFRDAVIRQYFLPIVAGEIVCTFEDEAGASLTLDSDNILSVIERLKVLSEGSSRDLSAEQVKTAMRAFVVAVDSCDPIIVEVPDDSTAPNSLAIPEAKIEEGLSSLEKFGVALFHITVQVPKPRTKETIEDYFEVLVTKAEGDNPIIYSREEILVPGTRAINVAGFMAIVMTSSGPLADLLGRAEGPAHEDWRDDTKRFKSDYEQPREAKARATRLLRVVRQFPKRIVQELARNEEVETDTSYFADWFVPPTEKEDGRDSGGLDPIIVDPDPPPPKNAGPSFSMNSGTLKVSSGRANYPVGSIVNLNLAYSVAKGSAFKKWKEIDFDLSLENGLKVSSAGAKVTSKAKNKISIEVLRPDSWNLEISGFRPYRDLEVKSDVSKEGGK